MNPFSKLIDNKLFSFFSKSSNDQNQTNQEQNKQSTANQASNNSNTINLFPKKFEEYNINEKNDSNTVPKKKINLFKVFADNPIIDNQEEEQEKPLSHQETEELLKNPKFEKVKLLKEKTDKAFLQTVTNKNQAGYVKSLVSKDKTRFCYDGFDLDLTYITPRIIAMGYPSKNIEGIYRNNIEDVQNFFNTRHIKHYKVYNLCEERKYKDCFYKQGYFPFKDHEAPPINLIRPFCEDVKKFLDEDEKNVVAIHCLAGKGRTGTFICCLLLYLNLLETAEECLLYYGLLRVGNIKGVTVPSQIRYVHYFETILKNKIPHPLVFKKIIIRKIKMFTIPRVGKKFQPNFTIQNNEKTFKYSDVNKRKENYSTSDFDLEFIEFPMAGGFTASGDVRVEFFQTQFLNLKNDKLFKFWFNTNFLPENGIFELKKENMDKACKDFGCKTYKKDFRIVLEFIYL